MMVSNTAFHWFSSEPTNKQKSQPFSLENEKLNFQFDFPLFFFLYLEDKVKRNGADFWVYAFPLAPNAVQVITIEKVHKR